MPLTVALDLRAQLGECPLWSAEEQALYFVDIKGRALHRYAPATGEHAIMPMPEDIGCIGFRAGGGFIAGFRSGLWLLDARGSREAKLADNPEDQRPAASTTDASIRRAASSPAPSTSRRPAAGRISTATTAAASRRWPADC